MGLLPDLLGTLATAFQIGIGGAGLRRLRFKNAFAGDLDWTPTANRTIVIPDASGSICLNEAAAITGGSIAGITSFTQASGTFTLPGLIINSNGSIQTTGVGTGSVTGDARGTGAVDLQTSRGSSSQVASGARSLTGGASCTASAQQAVALGFTCTSSANHAVSMCRLNTSSGQAAFSVGDSNISEAVNTATFGRSAYAKRQNEICVGAGGFTTTGDAQFSWMPLKASQTGTTLTELLSNTTAGGGTCVLQDDSALTFEIVITARAISAEEAASFQFTGLIRRGAGAATVALVGTPTKTVIARDVSTWDATVDADTTTGSLRVRVQGEAAKSIRWVARVNLVEVVA